MTFSHWTVKPRFFLKPCHEEKTLYKIVLNTRPWSLMCSNFWSGVPLFLKRLDQFGPFWGRAFSLIFHLRLGNAALSETLPLYYLKKWFCIGVQYVSGYLKTCKLISLSAFAAWSTFFCFCFLCCEREQKQIISYTHWHTHAHTFTHRDHSAPLLPHKMPAWLMLYCLIVEIKNGLRGCRLSSHIIPLVRAGGGRAEQGRSALSFFFVAVVAP